MNDPRESMQGPSLLGSSSSRYSMFRSGWRSPLSETPHQIPYRARECCGPDGIRTRTFELDRQTCYPLHHGPDF
jgi:hypothetical protein